MTLSTIPEAIAEIKAGKFVLIHGMMCTEPHAKFCGKKYENE